MESIDVSEEHAKFIKEFIQVFKENSVLWDKSHPQHQKQQERMEAFELLKEKCVEYVPDATVDFAKEQLIRLRHSFRKEYRKVKESMNTASSSDLVYKSSLWYYNLLLFTVGEEATDDCSETIQAANKSYPWSRVYTILLIDLMKKYPLTYQPAIKNNKGKRLLAFKQITEDLSKEVGKTFLYEDVRKKIKGLVDRYRRELKLRKARLHVPSRLSLWCFDLMKFVESNSPIKRCTRSEKFKLNVEESEEENTILKESDSDNQSMPCEYMSVKSDINSQIENDRLNNFGNDVAFKLRSMSDDQRQYTAGLINEVLYFGLMRKLTPDSKITVNGF